MHFTKHGMIIFSCLWLSQACAEHYSPSTAGYYPGISLTGLTGTVAGGYADVMIPVLEDQSAIYYFDPQGMYRSNNQYSGSVGAGGRWLTQNAGILGAYVFGDYNRSKYDNAFWFISPGVEHLGDNFDFSANLYFPIIRQHAETTNSAFASALGDYQYVTFQGHSEMDRIITQLESTGFGGDVQVGYRLPIRSLHNTRLYLGGYYFEPEDANTILGASIRAEMPLTSWLSLLASESYDSQYNNTLKAGLTVALAGRSTSYHFSGDLRTRMLDPIQRNLIAVAGGSGTSQPIVNSNQTTVSDLAVLVRSDITFFLPDAEDLLLEATDSATFQDGTFEHPYIGMTQEDVDAANAENKRVFYINTGDYTPSTEIVLENDSLYGRNDELGVPFAKPARGSFRPNFYFDSSGFILKGENNRVDSLKLTGNGGGNGLSADFFDNASPALITINNMEIGNFSQGVYISNTSRTRLDVIFNRSDIINNIIHGVRIDSTEDVAQTNVQVNASHFDDNGGAGFFIDSTSALGTPQAVSELNFNVNGSTFDRNNQDGLRISNNLLFSNYHVNNITLLNSTFNGNASSGFEITDSGVFLDNNINIIQDSFSNNHNNGLYIFNDTSLGGTNIHITDSEALNNTVDGVRADFSNNSTTFEVQGIDLSNNGENGASITSAANSFQADFDDVNSENNASKGVFLNFEGGVSNVNMAHSNISGNGGTGMTVGDYNPNTHVTLTLTDSILNNNAADGLYAIGADGNNILDLNIARTIFNANVGNGVSIFGHDQNTTNVTITESAMNNNGNNGLLIFNDASSSDTDIHITDSEALNNTVDGVQASFANNSTTFEIQGIDLSNNGENGASITSSANSFQADFDDVVSENNASKGVFLNFEGGVSNVNMAHSNISGNGGTGMTVGDYNPNTHVTLTLTDSILNNNAADGLYAIGVDGNNILDLNIARTAFNANAGNGVSLFGYDQNTTSVTITESAMNNNGNNGLSIFNIASSSDIDIHIADSEALNNTVDGVQASFANNSTTFEIQNSDFSNNGESGASITSSSNSFQADFDGVNAENNVLGGVLLNLDGGASNAFNVSVAHSNLSGNGWSGMQVISYSGNNNLTITITDSILNNNLEGLRVESFSNEINLNIARTAFNANSGDGISILSAFGTTNVTITDSTMNNNSNDGFSVETGEDGATLNMNIQNTSFNQNGFAGFDGLLYFGAAQLNLTATDCTFSENYYGVLGLNYGVPDYFSITLNNPTFSLNTYDTNAPSNIPPAPDTSPQPINWTFN